MTPITYLLLLYSFNCNKMSHKCTTGKTTQIQLGKKHEKVKSLLCTLLLYYASKMHFPNFLTLSRRSGFHSFFHSSREILVSLVISHFLLRNKIRHFLSIFSLPTVWLLFRFSNDKFCINPSISSHSKILYEVSTRLWMTRNTWFKTSQLFCFKTKVVSLYKVCFI